MKYEYHEIMVILDDLERRSNDAGNLKKIAAMKTTVEDEHTKRPYNFDRFFKNVQEDQFEKLIKKVHEEP